MTFFSFGDTCLDKKGVAPCTPVKVNILEKMSKYETLPIFYIKKVLPITTFFQMFSSCTNNGILLAITIAIAELLLYFSIQYPHHKVQNKITGQSLCDFLDFCNMLCRWNITSTSVKGERVVVGHKLKELVV